MIAQHAARGQARTMENAHYSSSVFVVQQGNHTLPPERRAVAIRHVCTIRTSTLQYIGPHGYQYSGRLTLGGVDGVLLSWLA